MENKYDIGENRTSLIEIGTQNIMSSKCGVLMIHNINTN